MTTVILLPGIVMPASVRYAKLQQALGGSIRTIAKELDVYADAHVPRDYSIDREVEGISRVADDLGLTHFHLYGHSGGGACALAYVAMHPDAGGSRELREHRRCGRARSSGTELLAFRVEP